MVQFIATLVETYLPEKEEGQGLVEYALILVLVSIAAFVTLGLLGTRVDAIFQEIITALTP